MFSLNTGKYGPEKTPDLDTFHAVPLSCRIKNATGNFRFKILCRNVWNWKKVWKSKTKLKKTLSPLFKDEAQLSQVHIDRLIFISMSPGVPILIWSISEGLNAESTWELPSGLNLKHLDWESSAIANRSLLRKWNNSSLVQDMWWV